MEVWLKGSSIAPYAFGNAYNHPEKQDRKLLLHKKEIEKLKKSTQEKGLTVIPLSIYLQRGKAKVRIGIAKGRKQHDKRLDTKKKEQERSIERALKESNKT